MVIRYTFNPEDSRRPQQLRSDPAGEWVRYDSVMWPNIIAPPKYDNPHPGWEDPELPDFALIKELARDIGYAVGLHGSMKRDVDLIAVPWTEDAAPADALIAHLANILKANVLGHSVKPHGRVAWSLQIDGWVKVIDISVCPRA